MKKNKLIITFFAIFFVILISSLVSSIDKTIYLNLDYGNNFKFDANQDGVELNDKIIDFRLPENINYI